MTDPESCNSMAEVRALIDQTDAEILGLFARRQRCIDRAAVLKRDIDWPARIPSRVEEVVANVRKGAVDAGFDEELAETLWRVLIDWSIAREEEYLTKKHGPGE